MGSGCSFTGWAKVGGIAGYARDGGIVTLTNVINCANVTSTGGENLHEGNTAGLIACAVDGTKITALNCANLGEVHGQDGQCAAFAGWTQAGTTFTNCWNAGTIYNMDNNKSLYRGDASAHNCYDAEGADFYTQGTKVAPATRASGELCYRLNGDQNNIGWYQNLTGEVDAYPVPFSNGHAQVYGNGQLKCDGSSAGGELTYSNSNESVIPPHTNANGWCTVCNALHREYLTPDDGYYSIGTANDLKWFAQYVADVDASVNAKLTAVINYSDNHNGFIGVPGKPFTGTFDGQEHTLTIAITNLAGVNRTGLFAAINGATIKNLVVEGTASSNDQNCVGGLGGRSDGNSTIENVIVKTAVSYTGSNGDATCGGFFANMEGTAILKNCAFLGSISTGSSNGNGGLVGWAGSGSNNKYTNCLVAPTAFDDTKGDRIARNNPSTTNCHFVASNDTRLASGELCYELNAKENGGEDWYQNLTDDIDAYPVPFASHAKVYGNGTLHCDGTPHEDSALTFGNTNEQIRDDHDVEGGFCNYCNIMTGYVEDYMTPAGDGAYEITNNKQMRWFAAKVKTYHVANNDDSNARINARLMDDIDFEGVTDYQPIGGLWGQGNARYAGEFDGQFHKITNLHIDLPQDNVGIFGVIAEGAVIKNFTVDSSCSIKGQGHVGIVGEAWRSHDGEFHLLGLGNEATIIGTGNNVGAILGVNMNNGGYAKCNMAYCYSTGTIQGKAENGQLTGWSGNDAYIENCYAIGDMINGDGFGRLGGGSTAVNCYSDKDLNWGPTKITIGMLASGELCYSLTDQNFRQTVGEGHPTFAGHVVYKLTNGRAVSYVNETIASLTIADNEEYDNLKVECNVPEAPAPTVRALTYTRGNTGGYNSVCLPFAVVNDDFGTDAQIEVFTSATSETVTLDYANEATAGAAIIVRCPADAADWSIEKENVTLALNPATAATGLNGSYTTKVLGTGFYKINEAGTQFQATGEQSVVYPFRAYLAVAGAAKTLRIVMDDASAIEAVTSTLGINDIFNINGVRQDSLKKGVNIVKMQDGSTKKIYVE